VVSLLLFFGGLIGLYLNHRRKLWASELAAEMPTAEAAGDAADPDEVDDAAHAIAEPGAAEAPDIETPVGEAKG
jgi:hypothetical protein